MDRAVTPIWLFAVQNMRKRTFTRCGAVYATLAEQRAAIPFASRDELRGGLANRTVAVNLKVMCFFSHKIATCSLRP